MDRQFFNNGFFRPARASIRRLSTVVGDLILPPLCLLCDAYTAQPGGCCAGCWPKLRHVAAPICPVMGTPFSVEMGDGMLSAEAIADPPPFDRLRFPLLYNDAARRLVTSLKYGDRLDLAPWMARWMSVAGSELIAECDVIVPVPLHTRRLLARRFNQSAELARHMARKSRKPFAPTPLQRTRATRQQVGLDKAARARNVQGAFRVSETGRIFIEGRRILLVDDVYTSGATVKASARALKRGGAKSVDVICFARVETGEG